MQTTETYSPVAGVTITGAVSPAYRSILNPEAVGFVATLARAFEARRQELLQKRVARQARIDAGDLPGLPSRNRRCARRRLEHHAPVPADLQDRRVEITGPVDRKMIINALNCGAKVFMADFEDANSPHLGK